MRPLPVHNKADVFDEWGAILRQQDEIDKKIQEEQYQKMRARQINYKIELDRQYKEQNDLKKGLLGEKMKREDELIKYQEKLLDQKAKQEENTRAKLRQHEKSDAIASFSEVQTRKQQHKMMKDMEIKMQRERIEQERKIHDRMQRDNMAKKKMKENEYYSILTNQAKEKQNKILQDKEADKQFIKAETDKLDVDEANRNKFFEKLKNIQVKNDQKQNSLMKYMKQDPKAISAKRDEQAYIRNIELGEKKAVKKEFSEKQNRNKNVVQNSQALSMQLQEKQFIKQAEKEQQKLLHKQFEDEVNKVRQEEIDERDKMKQRQIQYQKDLDNQLKEKAKKNQFSVLMSEHERCVNDGDLKAYQNMDTKTLCAKLPGFNSDNAQDKYIDKGMNMQIIKEPQSTKPVSR